MSRDDESTRAGDAAPPKPIEGTRFENRRIQVRMASGKIYGPYQRVEILGFIRSKKVHGDEKILYEGTTEWKEITSDPEFFDTFQQVQFGTYVTAAGAKKPGTHEGSLPGKPLAPEEPVERTEIRVQPREQHAPLPSRQPEGPPVELKMEVPAPVSGPTSQGLELEEVPVEPSWSEVMKSPLKTDRFKRPLPRWQKVTLGVIFILGALWWFGKTRTPVHRTRAQGAPLFSAKENQVYFQSLSKKLMALSYEIPELPAKIVGGGEIVFPEDHHGVGWIEDLAWLKERPAEEKLGSGYWARWAWDVLWLVGSVRPWDPQAAEILQSAGEECLEKLRSSQALSPEMDALMQSIPLFHRGQWDAVIKVLSSFVATSEWARYLTEEAQWWGYWEKGAKSAPPNFSDQEYVSSKKEEGLRIRRALFLREAQAPSWIEDATVGDPYSALPWFVGGELYWRVMPDQIQRANIRFVEGLSVLAFSPWSIQRVYWKQYGELLETFGRKSTAEKAYGNWQALESGNFAGWWDIGDEGLDVSLLSREILRRARMGPVSRVEIAALQVMGPLFSEGDAALVEAGRAMAFEGDWLRALAFFEDALKVNQKSVDALGGAIWASSKLFRFDEAFRYYDQLKQLPDAGYEGQKYNALIHFIGREYDEGLKDVLEYTKAMPADAWGYYFLAQMYVDRGKNVDCLKAAHLATVHGTGELSFRGRLLELHCQVLAKISTEEALQELKKIQSQNPRNIPAFLELTNAWMENDLVEDALRLTEDMLKKMPRAYPLRLRLGELYEKKGDYDRAVAFYLSAVKQRGDLVEPRLKIAEVYTRQERPLEAAANYKAAALLHPEYPEIWLLTARAFRDAGLWKEASEYYMKEVEERPAVLSSFIEFAEFMLKINAPQAVPEIFQKFKANYQDDPRVLIRLAQAYLALKDYEHARLAASEASLRDSNLAEPYRILAICSEQQGVYSTAKEFYEKYLKRFPQAHDAEMIRIKLSKPPFSQ